MGVLLDKLLLLLLLVVLSVIDGCGLLCGDCMVDDVLKTGTSSILICIISGNNGCVDVDVVNDVDDDGGGICCISGDNVWVCNCGLLCSIMSDNAQIQLMIVLGLVSFMRSSGKKSWFSGTPNFRQPSKKVRMLVLCADDMSLGVDTESDLILFNKL